MSSHLSSPLQLSNLYTRPLISHVPPEYSYPIPPSFIAHPLSSTSPRRVDQVAMQYLNTSSTGENAFSTNTTYFDNAPLEPSSRPYSDTTLSDKIEKQIIHAQTADELEQARLFLTDLFKRD